MQKLWKQTKKNITVGIHQMDEKLSGKAPDEPPEYIKAHDKLKKIEEQARSINKLINEAAADYKRLGKNYKDAFTGFDQTFTKNETHNDQMVASRQAGNDFFVLTERFANYYVPTTLLAPINGLLEKIKNAKDIKEKRRSNRILLKEEEGKLKDARTRGQNVEKREAEYNNRKEKFEQYDSEFYAQVKAVSKESKQVLTTAYNGFQFYLIELNGLYQNIVHEKLSSFPYEDNKSTFKSLTEPIPEERPSQ